MCFWCPKLPGRWGRPLETPAAGGTGEEQMARPTKAFHERRDDRLHVRLTADERARLEQSADALGLTVAEFLRRRGLDYRLPPAVPREKANTIATLTLMGLGNNINQMTRHAHAGHGLPVRGMLEDTLIRINSALDALNGSRDQPPGPIL